MPPLTGFPLEVIDTPFKSTDALAAGPKNGSFLFHQLSDQSCMLFFPHVAFLDRCRDLFISRTQACTLEFSTLIRDA